MIKRWCEGSKGFFKWWGFGGVNGWGVREMVWSVKMAG